MDQAGERLEEFRTPEMEGSPQSELFTIEIIIFLSLLLRNISLPWIFLGGKFNKSVCSFWLKFVCDYAFLVVPGLLSMTLLSSSLSISAIALAACVATLTLFVACEYLNLAPNDRVSYRHVMNKLVDEQNGPTTFVTYFRGSMLILIGLAILAVDFPVFPTRFHKTEHYGHSLMDIGVAACIFADAIGSRLKTASMWEKREARPRSWRRVFLSSKIVLPVIGLTRTFVVWLFNYHQPVTEYGVHWNFFYTMAVVKIVAWLLPSKFPLLSFCLFLVFQQSLLMHGWEKWILFAENPRDSLFLQNIEGITSLMGYIALHFGSLVVADFVAKTGIRIKSWIECTAKLFLLAGLLFVIQLVSDRCLGPSSRRIANTTYVFSQLSLLVFSLASLLAVQMFNLVAWAANAPHFASSDNPFSAVQPCLLDSVNKRGLVFFLLCNVLTGSVNLSVDTATVDNDSAVLLVAAYMFICCLAVHFSAFLKVSPKRKV